MILDLLESFIGIPDFQGTDVDYWVNTYYMLMYSSAFVVLIYLIKRLMLIFDWGVKIGRFIKGRMGR